MLWVCNSFQVRILTESEHVGTQRSYGARVALRISTNGLSNTSSEDSVRLRSETTAKWQLKSSWTKASWLMKTEIVSHQSDNSLFIFPFSWAYRCAWKRMIVDCVGVCLKYIHPRTLCFRMCTLLRPWFIFKGLQWSSLVFRCRTSSETQQQNTTCPCIINMHHRRCCSVVLSLESKGKLGSQKRGSKNRTHLRRFYFHSWDWLRLPCCLMLFIYCYFQTIQPQPPHKMMAKETHTGESDMGVGAGPEQNQVEARWKQANKWMDRIQLATRCFKQPETKTLARSTELLGCWHSFACNFHRI